MKKDALKNATDGIGRIGAFKNKGRNQYKTIIIT